MKTISILIVLLGLTQCASTKLETQTPFKLASATYNHWIGGLPGVNGTKVEIRLSEKTTVVFEKLYFLNKSIQLETKEEKGKTLLIANFINSSANKRDIILDSDSKKELKNKLPSTKKTPFMLKENQAVISYKIQNKIKYFKINNLKKVQPKFYPKARN